MIPLVLPIFIARMVSPIMELFTFTFNKTPLYTNQTLNILKKSSKHISYAKAKRDLDYQPRPIKVTLKDTFEWHKNTIT